MIAQTPGGYDRAQPEKMCSLQRPTQAPCGTNARYVAGCRCDECRRAATVLSKKIRLRRARGQAPFVDATEARNHVRSLVARGKGSNASSVRIEEIAKRSGVGETSIRRLLYGEPARAKPPKEKVRRETAEKLLAVTHGDGMPRHVDARQTWRMIECLRANGVSKASLSRAIGQKHRGLQLSKSRVSREHARRIEQLHWSAWMSRPALRRHCDCPMPSWVSEKLEDAS